MRRRIAAATVITLLMGASAALGALNSYGADFAFSPNRAGTAKRPSPVGFVQTLNAANAMPSQRAAPLIDIRTKIYGLQGNGGDFPTCARATIVTGPRFDAACPVGSQVATGRVDSLLGPEVLSKPGTPCRPRLHVYNAGPNRLWFFFTTSSGTDCNGLRTGATAPWEGFSQRVHNYLVTDVPLPADISTRVSGLSGLYGSLIRETLTWRRLTRKVRGKTVGFQESVGCKSGRRPWSVTFTAVAGGQRESRTVAGSRHC